MKKHFTTIFILLLVSMALWSQDTIKHLIISEARYDSWRNAYVELTNMGAEPVDLSNFTYACVRFDLKFKQIGDEVQFDYQAYTGLHQLTPGTSFTPAGILQPGESYMFMAVQDAMNNNYPTGGRPVQSIEILMRADSVIHYDDFNGGNDKTYPFIPEWEMWGFDSISLNKGAMDHRNFTAGALFWTPEESVIALVDQVLLDINWTTGLIYTGENLATVAGVQGASEDYNLVRKYSVKEGETNWTLAAGVNAATSQWILIPHNDDLNHMAFTTEGVHGDFHIDVSSDIYDIDEDNSTITVPWGTQKFDSIRVGLNLGPGMAWEYLQNENFEDSLSWVCNTGDTLVLYACGNDLEIKKYVIQVADPAGDMVEIYPRHNINYPDPDDEDYTPDMVPTVGGTSYYVMRYEGVLDTIINVAYATKVDTLLTHLDKAPGASWEIVFAGGETNNEVSYGDLLRVTGSDGTTTKDYFIKVEEYEKSNNINLASITWPDRPATFMEGWLGDTLPGFSPSRTSYTITLPPGTKAVPALLAEPQNLNAKIEVQRAVSLQGGIAERTTRFIVTSESDTMSREVTVLFNVLNPFVQNYVGDPIFSKFYKRHYWGGGMMEICNPSDELVDLSNYMIVVGNPNLTNPADVITQFSGIDSTTWLRRYNKYVPGYKFVTYRDWAITPGVLELDNQVSPYLDPGDVLVFGRRHNAEQTTEEGLMERVDIWLNSDERNPGEYFNPWNEPLDPDTRSVAMPLFPDAGQTSRSLYFMFQILNDSIKAGTKNVFDPSDFKLVDCFGSIENGAWSVGGRELTGTNIRFVRLPEYYQGVTTVGEGLVTQWRADSHEDRFTDPETAREQHYMVLGSHTLAPITGHLSTVSSLVYKVDIGYEGELGIAGVSNSETVDGFFANLIKADQGQTLTVLSVTDGAEKAGGDAVAEGDTLQVVSGTGDNLTKYEISIVPLDGDAVLTAVDGSGLSISVDGSEGSVGGFIFGMTLRTVLDNVNVPEKAILNIINASGNLVPLQRLNTDTVYVDVVANTHYYFEVVAENGNTIVYQLDPVSAASDAYVLSDIYEVSEDPIRIIRQVQGGIAVPTLMQNVYPAPGATVKIVSITGQERTMGQVSIDDKLEVTSEDASVTVVYELNFIGEFAAYVTSETLTVSQSTVTITVEANTDVADMLAALIPAPEATVVVKDVDGNEKSTGTVESTDVVVVISADGVNEVTYTINVLVSVYNSLNEHILVYPNPARDVLYVKNIPVNTKVRITDITGRSRSLIESERLGDGIDLSGMKQGMYFLSVEKDGIKLATLKVLVQ